MSDSVLTPAEAAEYLGLSQITLKRWRLKGEGPPHYRVGVKLVRYRQSDVDRWLSEKNRSTKTSPSK